jgi:hypothetical protein
LNFWMSGSNLQFSSNTSRAASELMSIEEFHNSAHHPSHLWVDSFSFWTQRLKSSIVAGHLPVHSKFLMKIVFTSSHELILPLGRLFIHERDDPSSMSGRYHVATYSFVFWISMARA